MSNNNNNIDVFLLFNIRVNNSFKYIFIIVKIVLTNVSVL